MEATNTAKDAADTVSAATTLQGTADVIVPHKLCKPLTLTDADIARVHKLVARFLPPEYDRAYVADTIILNAWMRDVPHISYSYVRHKCTSAWRQLKRERRRNEEAYRAGAVSATRNSTMIKPNLPTPGASGGSSGPTETEAVESEREFVDRKILVQEAVGVLSPFERKLIWMRFYDNQTLDEMSQCVKLRRDELQQALKVALYKMRIRLE